MCGPKFSNSANLLAVRVRRSERSDPAAVRRRRTGAGERGSGEDGGEGEGSVRGTAVSAGSVENNSAAVWGEQRAGADGSQRMERFRSVRRFSIGEAF